MVEEKIYKVMTNQFLYNQRSAYHQYHKYPLQRRRYDTLFHIIILFLLSSRDVSFCFVSIIIPTKTTTSSSSSSMQPSLSDIIRKQDGSLSSSLSSVLIRQQQFMVSHYSSGRKYHHSIKLFLSSSSSSSSSESNSNDSNNNSTMINEMSLSNNNNSISKHNYDIEETLLAARLQVLQNSTIDDAINSVIKFCQSYPFSVVLPVQPLMYIPTTTTITKKDRINNIYDGVEIKFLRKKTLEKSSIDGGIRFFISSIHLSNTNDDIDSDDDDLNENENEIDIIKEAVKTTTTGSTTTGSTVIPTKTKTIIEIIAKRNSQGQSISKVFAEKLIITSFVASLIGSSTTLGTPPTKYTTVSSIFHKWM